MTFGWTFEHIDEFVTLPQLDEMSRFWKKNPPVHQMVAAYFRIGKKGSAAEEEPVPAEDALMALFRDVLDSGGSVPSDAVEMAQPPAGASLLCLTK